MAENLPVEASLFEGLVRALKPGGAFAEDLKKVGFDPQNLRPRYSIDVWRDTVETARRHVYPNEPPEIALRQMGRRFAQGFFDTLIGKIITASFPIMGPDMMIKMSPRNVKAGRKDIEVIPTKEGEKRWRVGFRDVLQLGEFVAGLVEEAGKRTGVEMKVAVDVRSPTGYELLITW